MTVQDDSSRVTKVRFYRGMPNELLSLSADLHIQNWQCRDGFRLDMLHLSFLDSDRLLLLSRHAVPTTLCMPLYMSIQIYHYIRRPMFIQLDMFETPA